MMLLTDGRKSTPLGATQTVYGTASEFPRGLPSIVCERANPDAPPVRIHFEDGLVSFDDVPLQRLAPGAELCTCVFLGNEWEPRAGQRPLIGWGHTPSKFADRVSFSGR
jgi:hypothetical protein